MSLFISLEGGEGCGKTTQVDRLCQRLASANIQAMLIHEPGTTPLGLHLRNLVKGRPWGGETISRGAELFLFAAARAELVTKVLKPTLQRHRNVVIVADRYADSTTAYQGYGRRLPLSQVRAINSLSTQGVMPDLTLLFDCPPEAGLKRKRSLQIELPLESTERSKGNQMDRESTRRFEEESLDFHERVRAGYLKMARAEPDRWRVIDATKPIEDIGDIVWRFVLERLPEGLTQEAANLTLEPPPLRESRSSKQAQ